MSKKPRGKASSPFGKRAREAAPKAERKPTPMQRLAALGKRWLAGPEPVPGKDARKMGFRRSRPGR